MITYKETKEYSIDKIVELYKDAGWISYTENPSLLKKAYDNSDYVLFAWDKDKLVGTIRVITDF